MRSLLLNLQPLPPPPSGSRLVGFGFAALLNIGFVVALALGLVAHFQTKPPPGTDTVVIIPNTEHPPIPKDPIDKTWKQPVIDQPIIDYADPDEGRTITETYTDQSTQPQPAIAWVHSRPDYPPLSRKLGEEGIVRLVISIDERGFVSEAHIIGSSGFPRLDEAAASWVKAHWRYQPAAKDGKPVPAKTTATVTFKLT